ncbi:MAG: putative toxin-antitoxin system toxin component, PIN family [Lachnospiraceae bacterium]|nr:putative toxin-antitoxin system toxin component, PIN family [Lachnospiraceae bacterium]
MIYYVVIDTNVLVSAMLKKNTPPDAIIRQVFKGNIIPLLNEEILDEYREVLGRTKFKFPESAVKDIITGITKDAVFMDAAPTEQILPDSKDIVFYEVVMEGKKSKDAYLVTGNLKHFPKSPYIVDPREMLEIMKQSKIEEDDKIM